MPFLIYCCGKTDPSDFFYGLRLTFDSAPHLVQLKQAVEQRVAMDNVLPDGSRYVVTDLEILDMRLNMWTPLDTRSQLYSGCHICAVRDTGSGTSAGPIDFTRKIPAQRALGFMLDVESTFRALDVENRGLVSLSNVLHVFRHDLNYAVDFFQAVDVRNTGQVTLQDLSAATRTKSAEFWKNLQLRISRGGLDPGNTSNRPSLMYTASGVDGGGGSTTPRSTAAGSGANTPAGVMNTPSRAGTPTSGRSTPTAGAAAAGGGAGGTRRQGIAAAILASAKQKQADEEAAAAKTSGAAAGSPTSGSFAGSMAGSMTPNASDLDPHANKTAAARKVIELFQKTAPKTGQTAAKSIVSKMMAGRRPGTAGSAPAAASSGAPASASGSASTMQSPMAGSTRLKR